MRSPENYKRNDKWSSIIRWMNENKKTVIKALLIIIVLSLSILVHFMNVDSGIKVIEENGESEMPDGDSYGDEKTSDTATGSAANDENKVQYIDISGAINRPGVYSVPEGTRLFEVIEMAGGLSDEADIDYINQASFVADGDKIIIPTKGGDETYRSSFISNNYTDDSININYASREELMQLPGVGETLADRIIEYRTGNRFKTIEDIKKVSGIGDATYERMKDKLSV